VNRFFEWIGLKEKLQRSEHRPPFVSERDLWWASLGQNVGSEVNGKSDRSHPVLIMQKLAHGFYLVAPTTTKPREGTGTSMFASATRMNTSASIKLGRSITAAYIPM
jgi:hypothetical protein